MHQEVLRARLRARFDTNPELLQNAVAKAAGLSESMLSKRMTGHVDFSDEDEHQLDLAIDRMTRP